MSTIERDSGAGAYSKRVGWDGTVEAVIEVSPP
jgi:hypothetical protein